MYRAKIWYEKNKTTLLWAVVLGMAWVFLHTTAITARESGQPWHTTQVIRLHILAHDDSPEEQAMKLALRDSIWHHLHDMISAATTLEDARAIISQNILYIEDMARQIAPAHHITARLAENQSFPAMSYGGIIFPRGHYEALEITIGKGIGRNWWCVMFPPMCLMDVTRGEVILLHEGNTNAIVVRPRFRLVEMWQNLFN